MKRLPTCAVAITVLVIGSCLTPVLARYPALAQQDTGTYRILDYAVTLEPQSSGAVRITYEQEWRVLSGNIPWITVGLPNSQYSVEEYGGDASRVFPDNSGGFTGVRADLNRRYLSGETFKVRFVVLQRNLLERLTQEKKWRISYTPGWYDRAVIDHLKISLLSPVSLETYSLVNPAQTSSAGNVMTWERANLQPGGRFTVRAESLDGSFLSTTAGVPSARIDPMPIIIGTLVTVLIVILIVLVVRKVRRDRQEDLKARIVATEQQMVADRAKKEEIEKGFREYIVKEDIEPDEQGRYYDRGYGDYITPAIWAAVILHQQQQREEAAREARTTGHSCACACVSCACACACACAGGGAAGCTKKTLHECRECLGASESIGSQPVDPL
jgi:hypothetical protein